MEGYLIGYVVSGAIIFLAILLALFAQIKVNSTYQEYSNVQSKSGITGNQLAQTILDATGNKAALRQVSGHLTDNYNPVNHTVNISQKNYNSSTIAGLGVVAHEMGHYLQHNKKYLPFYIRQTVVKVCNFASGLLLPMLLLGILLNVFLVATNAGNIIIWVAVAIYATSFLANLVTLPVEIDASRRAVKMLKNLNILDSNELAGTKKVLLAASLTYVASALVSLGYFLRLLFYALIVVNDR